MRKYDVYGNCKAASVPTQDPLLDFNSEVTLVYTDPIPAPTSWPVAAPPIHAIDTTSRVVSFVLGFALASVIAWVGSISGDEVAATGNSAPVASHSAPVASVGTPVVAADIHEKKPATIRDPEPTGTRAVAASSTASASGSAPRLIAVAAPAAVAPPTPVAPAKTAEAAPAPPIATAARTSRQTTNGYRGGLSLTSSPAGAQVVLNGKVVGETPVVLNDLPVGSRAIVVRRDGYSPWSASVRVVANQRTAVRANLIPQSGS
ncbi:MAG TPA: PEGA domain-containing protein [Vicinamibacterales bacterium]